MKTHAVYATLLLAACGGPVGIEQGSTIVDSGLALAPSRGGIIGIVVDAQGRAVPSAHVFTQPRGFEATADIKGRFELPWLPPSELILVAGARGWEPGTSEQVAVVAGGIAEVEIVLGDRQRQGVVTVTVTDPEGEPVAGAVVEVSDGSTASTDSDGIVLLEGVAGEDLTLTVEHDDTWARSLDGVTITDAGGLQWSVQLSGRSDGEVDGRGNGWCEVCHADVVEAFAQTPHGRAFTREPSDALREQFEGAASVGLDGALATLQASVESLTVTLEDADGLVLDAEVSGFIGDPESQTVPMVSLNDRDYPLPLVWITGSEARDGHPCSEARWEPFQQERWFDGSGAFVFAGDAPDPASGAASECLPCHVSGFTLTVQDDGGAELSSEDGEWMDDGVGCERCHGPGLSHLYSMDPRDIVNPALLDRDRANEVCGQCHARRSGLGSGLPHPHGEDERYQPGEVLADTTLSEAELWSSGAAAADRMQHDELSGSPHGADGAGLRCFDCHDVHGGQETDPDPLLHVSARDNALCEACHLDSSFDADEWTALEHMGHRYYAPDGSQEAARCVHCHMPATASGTAWCDETGSGTLSSHLFEALSPQHTLDVFDDSGVGDLAVGWAPPHACLDCHAWNAWYFDSLGLVFPGVHGEPTRVETHQAYLDSFEEVLP